MKRLSIIIVIILFVGCTNNERSDDIDNDNMKANETPMQEGFESKNQERVDDEYSAATENNEKQGIESCQDEGMIHQNNNKGKLINVLSLNIINDGYHIPEGYLKDVVWSGDNVLDKVLVTHIFMSEVNRNLFSNEQKSQYLHPDDIEEINQYIEFSERNINKDKEKYWESLVYDSYVITPFYTEFSEYIGIQFEIQVGDYKNLNYEEKFKCFCYNNEFEGKYYTGEMFYTIDKDGYFRIDTQGYFDKRYQENRCNNGIETEPGKLIFINHFVDYSKKDYGSQVSNLTSQLGVTRWTDDVELNKAIFAFILHEYSFDRRFCDNLITTYLNEDDANVIVELNNLTRSYEAPAMRISKFDIEYYEDDIFIIKIVKSELFESDSLDINDFMSSLNETYYVIKLEDGKYDVFTDTEFDEIN